MIESGPPHRVRYELEPWLVSDGPGGPQGTRLGPAQHTASSLAGIFARYKGLVAASSHTPSYIVNRVTEARLVSSPAAADEGPDPAAPSLGPQALHDSDPLAIGGIETDFVVRNRISGNAVSAHPDLTSALAALRATATEAAPLTIDVRVVEHVALLTADAEPVIAPQIASARAQRVVDAMLTSLQGGTVRPNRTGTAGRAVDL